MRPVKSLSSLSTLVVGSTLSSCQSASAFAPSMLSSQSHSNLMTLSTIPSGGDIPLSIEPESIMTAAFATTTTAAAFLGTSAKMTDPNMLLGHETEMVQQQQQWSQTPAFVRPQGEESANNHMLVPPTKSLREKLHLSTMTTPAASTAAGGMTSRPRIVGHRGSLYEELENTRPAFLACAGICDAVELDVFLLKDGSLVVFHGSGTDKNPGFLNEYCTNANEVHPGATTILDLTLEEAQQLKFNTEYAELAAPASKVQQGKIPTLEQVLLDLQPTGMEVKIELKGAGTAKPVVELVDRLNMATQCSFSSFNFQEISMVRQLKPERNLDDNGSFVYRTGALFDDVPSNYLDMATAVGASEVHLRYDTCTVDRVRDIHATGMGSMVWMRGPVGMKNDVANKFWDIGNEDESCFATLLETGVQQLCVNRPKVLYDLLQKQGGQAKPEKIPTVYDVAMTSDRDLLSYEQGRSTMVSAHN